MNLSPYKTIFSGKKVLIGVTGSIAAFKVCELVRYLKETGASVRVILTDSAQKFVTPITLETLSGEPVLTGLWPHGNDSGFQGTHHIESARWADLMFIVPASANTIAKMAHGIADDLLSTEYLAFRGPVLVAPAMNPAMFHHPAVQSNLELLQSRGVRLVGPAHGLTACGEEGAGRLLEPSELLEHAAEAFYAPKKSKQVLISLGPTQSALDPVRYLSNRSSGKMGAALCWAAAQAGYDVLAVRGPVDVSLPRQARVIDVQTADEMAEAVMELWPRAEVYFGAAAVLDWDVASVSSSKLKKEQGQPQIQFTQNRDILAEVVRAKNESQKVVGFAAETDSPIENGMKKLQSKGCDALFVNPVGKSEGGFHSDENAGWWLTKNDQFEFKLTDKFTLARQMIGLLENSFQLTQKDFHGSASASSSRLDC